LPFLTGSREFAHGLVGIWNVLVWLLRTSFSAPIDETLFGAAGGKHNGRPARAL